jgi:hypothetical protein
MKINVDASFTEGAMTGGWDFVVQNEAGEIECAGVGKINAVSSPLTSRSHSMFTSSKMYC